MKASVGAWLSENAATATGSKAKHHRHGSVGPPVPTPVKTGLQMRLLLGTANTACLAMRKVMMRSTSQVGVCRHSKTALTQAGER
eukprot:8380778-Alexandrium_andersonii.AAC.1